MLGEINSGDTIAMGGWGPTRKPMAIVRAIARSDLKDLTVMSLAGLDLDLLIGAGKVKKAVYPFVALEGAPGAVRNFRRARQEGAIEAMELSEYMFIAGLKAAAERLPFYPCRSGLGSDVLTVNPGIVTFEAPYTKETLVAMPPLKADVVLVHVNAADPSGNGYILGDPLWDTLMVSTGKKVFLSTEKVVSSAELKKHFNRIEILSPWISGVVELPFGAHPGQCYPDYGWDASHLGEYGRATADPQAFKDYLDKYVNKVEDNSAYVEIVGGAKRLSRLQSR
jgi:glutaconate CoA-transferase subunit A